MSKKMKINLDEVLKGDDETANVAPAVDAAVEEAVDVAQDVADAVAESEFPKEPVEAKPEPVRVIVSEVPKSRAPKLSDRTLAEMERGRRALAERNGK